VQHKQHDWSQKMMRPSNSMARVGLLIAGLLLAPATPAAAQEKVQTLSTPEGIRFTILGEKPAAPAATLFVFATGAQETLEAVVYSRAGRILAKDGWLSVSVDIACHGNDARDGEPGGIEGWRRRLDNGEEWLPAFAKRSSSVLDYLIKEGYTDPQRVAACGTSRGGFSALHFAAAEARVKAVAGFAPVTNLLALREFAGTKHEAAANALAAATLAPKLADRAVWVCIGAHDERVSTDDCVAFTRKVVAAAVAAQKKHNVELHVMPSPGHTIHETAHEEVAAWLKRQVPAGK
jgi:dienelactone hydrolase